MLETRSIIFAFPTFEDFKHLYDTCPNFYDYHSSNEEALRIRWNQYTTSAGVGKNPNQPRGNIGILCTRFASSGEFTSFGDISCYTSATSLKEIEAGTCNMISDYTLYKMVVYRRPAAPRPSTIEDTLIF